MSVIDIRYWQGELSAESGYEAWLYVDDGNDIMDVIANIENWSGRRVRITVELLSGEIDK